MLYSITPDAVGVQSTFSDFVENLPYRPYCTEEPGNPLLIRGRDIAVRFPLIQPNPPAFVHWLVFDIDHDQAGAAALDAGLPEPAWIAVNPENQHAHIVYGLTTPVCKTDAARPKPLRFCEAVERGMGYKLNSDPGYCGLITKNPTHAQWRVIWNKNGGRYDLSELAEYVDLTIPRPRVAKNISALGRNCALFECLRHWSYSAIRRQGWPSYPKWLAEVSAQAHAWNQFANPLPFAEVNGIARSIARWTHTHITQAGFSALQAQRGARSHGGGRPKSPQSREQKKLWKELGVSRRTMYRMIERGEITPDELDRL